MPKSSKYNYKTKKPIILFDGYCNLCNASVNFIIRRDRKDLFRFATFQSDAGKEIAKKLGIENIVSDTIILYRHGKIYTRSTAAIIISSKLSGLWPILYIFIVIPPPLRNGVYNLISRNRYKWFGRKENCMMPTKETLEKFI